MVSLKDILTAMLCNLSCESSLFLCFPCLSWGKFYNIKATTFVKVMVFGPNYHNIFLQKIKSALNGV